MASIVLLEPCDRTSRGIVRVLIGAGHRCTVAGTAEAALRLIIIGGAEVLVADVDALKIGAERCSRAFRSAAPDLRILLLSGGHPHHFTAHCSVSHCCLSDAVLLKPFEDEHLLAAIEQVSTLRPKPPRDGALCPCGHAGPSVRPDAHLD